MNLTWTDSQKGRLKALGVSETEKNKCFTTSQEREKTYQQLEKDAVKQLRYQLDAFRHVHLRPKICKLEERLVQALIREGFVQITTPIIMSKGHLAKMSIIESHPLFSQVYWIASNKCLRPMLAPHLYYILKDLLRLWTKPVRIFEIGPCFRKESQGAQHSSEFTMLNLVEMGLPEGEREDRIKVFADMVTKAAGIKSYTLKKETSTVYGDTIDVVAGKEPVELGSSAMGPHPLDQTWKITDAWVGIGFGIERLLMVAEGGNSLARVGRSLTYLDGVRLNIQGFV